jgi:peroxiredoxin
MTGRQQWIAVLAIVLALAGGLFVATRMLGDELFPITVGSRAPEFQARTLTDSATAKSLGDYRGQVVLLNIWATWCLPCRTEMPSIEALHREYGPRGLRVVAVSVDDPGSERAVRQFARELGLTFEILHDPQQGTTRNYQITGYPETFIIARDGTIRRKMIGPDDWSSSSNRALVRELLGVSAPTVADPRATGLERDAPDSVTLDGAATPAK